MLKLFRSVVIGMSALLVLVLPRYSPAELQSMDDPIFGPGAITYDTDTGLEWLDLTFSADMTRSEVTEEMEPAGYLEGFRRPLIDEIEDLYAHAGTLWPWTDPNYSSYPMVMDATASFIELIGPTHIDGYGCPAIEAMTGECYYTEPAGFECLVIGLSCWNNMPGVRRYRATQGGEDTLDYIGAHYLVRDENQDPKTRIESLSSAIDEMNIGFGIANSLYSKLRAASQALDDLSENNNISVINKLQAFINAVEAKRVKHIPDDDANDLIAAAQDIIDMLSLQ